MRCIPHQELNISNELASRIPGDVNTIGINALSMPPTRSVVVLSARMVGDVDNHVLVVDALK